MTATTDKKAKNGKSAKSADDVFDTVKAEAAEELTEDTGEELTEAEVSEDGAADGSEDPAPPPAREADTKRSASRVVATVAATLVFVLVAGGFGFLGWKLWQSHQLNQAREQAQAAAVAYAQVLTSIDSDKVDENFNQVLAGSTGEFRDMYSKSSMQLRQLLIDNKATAHGVVVESAVQSATPNKVVVLLFVDQSVSNTSVPDPRIDRSRIKMTLEKVDGQWRTSKVELP